MDVRMYVCMYVRRYVGRYVCMYVCVYVCVCMPVCLPECMYVCMYICMYGCTCMNLCMTLCTYVFICVCTYAGACMCVPTFVLNVWSVLIPLHRMHSLPWTSTCSTKPKRNRTAMRDTQKGQADSTNVERLLTTPNTKTLIPSTVCSAEVYQKNKRYKQAIESLGRSSVQVSSVGRKV